VYCPLLIIHFPLFIIYCF
jgi:ABC-type multidrug transport system fused ATPase/permease subunit